MTILIHYRLSPYKKFKAYYVRHACQDLRRDFPNLVSYDRFVTLIPRTLIPLMLYLADRCQRSLRMGIYYIDSTLLHACHPKRAHQHRTIKGFASWAGRQDQRGLVHRPQGAPANQLGQLVHDRITSGSTHDTSLRVLYQLTHDLVGWVFGDKGYLLNTEKKDFLERQGEITLAAKPRKAMARSTGRWPPSAMPKSVALSRRS